MRHPLRLGLWAAVLLLALGLAGYTVFWFIAAGRIEDGLTQWALSLRPQNLELTWKAVRVGGFPLTFDVELSEVRLHHAGSSEVAAPVLSAAARPWNFRVWQLALPQGLNARAAQGGDPAVTLSARSATGAVAAGVDGGATIWFALAAPSADIGMRLAAKDADLWLNLPPQMPQSHAAPALDFAVAARQVALPKVPAPFTNPLDEISFGVRLKGALPAAPLRQAAAAWRDAGGTLDLDHLALRWGNLAVRGSGTLALDRQLQPEGAFAGAVAGYDQLMTALVAAGRMRAGDAQLARLALTMLATAGPDGRPEIATSFTIQDGEMLLGPARLGRAPRIEWQ